MQKSSHRFGNAYVCMQYIYIYRSPPRPLLLDGRGLSRARVRFTMHYRFAAHLTRRVCAFKRDDHLGREASPCPPDALSPGLGADLAHGTRLASAAQVPGIRSAGADAQRVRALWRVLFRRAFGCESTDWLCAG